MLSLKLSYKTVVVVQRKIKKFKIMLIMNDINKPLLFS